MEIYSALIENENGKAKPTYYLVQIVDCDDPNDQRQNWIHGDPLHIVTDLALARAIGFYNKRYWVFQHLSSMLGIN